MAKTKRSRLSDMDREVLKAAADGISDQMKWLQTEAHKLRDDSNFEGRYKKLWKEYRKNDWMTLQSAAKLFEWEKGKHTEQRNKLGKLTNSIIVAQGLSSASVAVMVFNSIKRLVEEELTDPTDALLSKKEAKLAKKRRKIEKKHGVKKEIKRASSDEEKKLKSRLRRLTRNAKKENLSVEDYCSKNGYDPNTGLKG